MTAGTPASIRQTVGKSNAHRVTPNKGKVIAELPAPAEFTKFAIRVAYARDLPRESPESKSLLAVA
jgi:hypothetical protein